MVFKQRRVIPRVKGACSFCKDKTEPDYKKPEALRKFMTDRGRILSRDHTGLCAKHQRQMGSQVRRGRHLALLPFATATG